MPDRKSHIRAELAEATNLHRAITPPSASTQNAPSFAESSSPWIPPELISRILTNLWEAPQTPQERSALLKNITLVNRTWLTLVALITSRDVHISHKRNANAFLRSLSNSSPRPKADDLFTAEKTRFANDACRSLTFHVVDGELSRWPGPLTIKIVAALIRRGRWPSPADDADNAISLVLDKISAPDCQWHLPNLQHISLRYRDRGFADVFDHLELGPFPPQVARLSIHCSFSVWHLKFTLSQLWMETRDDTRGFAPLPAPGGTRRVVPTIPNLRHLALSGATTAFVTAILPLCPNVETLEITQPSAVRLEAIGPQVPSALRTLILRHPGAVSGEQLSRWELCLALGSGLFPARGTRATKPRIVVRSGTIDPVAFAALGRECERFHVELVHEPDDA